MKQMQYDLAQAMGKTALADRPQTLTQLIGADVDSSFREPMSYQVSSATSEISIGGQNAVNPGANIQVAIRDESVLMNVHRSAIAFDVTFANGYVENALELF